MSNITTSYSPAYEPNVPAAAVVASIFGISLIGWIVQSIQARFRPYRLNILILLSHLTIFSHFILRAALPTDTRNTIAASVAMSILLAIGQRTIILANYDFLTQVDEPKSPRSRIIINGSILAALASAILVILAGISAQNTDTTYRSFQLRQASSAIVLCMTILFFPIWIIIKATNKMIKQGIILLIISGLSCLIFAVYLMIASVPTYAVSVNQQEFWFYIFQLIPTAIALFTWTILHPKRSLVLPHQQQEDIAQEEDNRL